MANELAQILDELREDHRNMAILLNLLEQELDRIRANKAPDYELLTDIMRYMTSYSDAVHHPKEDLLYNRMRAASPKLAASLEPVEEDHRRIAKLGEKLRAEIGAMVSGAAVKRERMTEDMIGYLERLRGHMAWEEAELFEEADKLIRKSPGLAIDDAHLRAADPVFGLVREASYSNLLKNIRAMAQG
jgi:hemerythrin-like domain-containing protein